VCASEPPRKPPLLPWHALRLPYCATTWHAGHLCVQTGTRAVGCEAWDRMALPVCCKRARAPWCRSPAWAHRRARARAGVALGYSQLTDADIISLPVPQLQTDGLLFVWVINAKYKFTLDLFDRWGYTCGHPAAVCHNLDISVPYAKKM
jgi:hypothetical protein